MQHCLYSVFNVAAQALSASLPFSKEPARSCKARELVVVSLACWDDLRVGQYFCAMTVALQWHKTPLHVTTKLFVHKACKTSVSSKKMVPFSSDLHIRNNLLWSISVWIWLLVLGRIYGRAMPGFSARVAVTPFQRPWRQTATTHSVGTAVAMRASLSAQQCSLGCWEACVFILSFFFTPWTN